MEAEPKLLDSNSIDEPAFKVLNNHLVSLETQHTIYVERRIVESEREACP